MDNNGKRKTRKIRTRPKPFLKKLAVSGIFGMVLDHSALSLSIFIVVCVVICILLAVFFFYSFICHGKHFPYHDRRDPDMEGIEMMEQQSHTKIRLNGQ
ncbi:hypothetical protein NPIL_325811 [Nephila pilipes]|uniref:Uncharacterized protein n=1 Tax=Nephila pilipes TaxID=299642 RepID=A0A8X6PMP6_NEPPI|nr:hypothetical protein NPIL_325811 [Nephila pilipes]